MLADDRGVCMREDMKKGNWSIGQKNEKDIGR